MKKTLTIWAMLIGSSAVAAPQLTSYSVGSGGGVSGVGNLQLSFTIGQCDATPQALSFGTFEMGGGFWPGFAVPPCAADFNHDGGVDFFDYLDFVDLFSLGVPEADFNGDSSIDFFDYLDFVDAFSIGC